MISISKLRYPQDWLPASRQIQRNHLSYEGGLRRQGSELQGVHMAAGGAHDAPPKGRGQTLGSTALESQVVATLGGKGLGGQVHARH